MYYSIFKRILLSGIFSIILCFFGAFITYYCQNFEIAKKVTYSYIFRFNGILIIAFAYGLLCFIRNEGANVFEKISNIMESDINNEKAKYFTIANSRKKQHLSGMILAITGGVILWNCGYPYSGFPKYFLAVASISLFYVGGMMAPFWGSIFLFFHFLDKNHKTINLKKGQFISMEINDIDSFLMICCTMGITALYLSFRGTITADFTYENTDSLIKALLSFPIILFFPPLLFFSYYYRHVLRKIQNRDMIKKIDKLVNTDLWEKNEKESLKDVLEIHKIVIHIKEKFNAEDKVPIISLKDYPALFFIILFIMQVIIQYDQITMNFFKTLFK
ncbi:hypothetical protein CSA08_04960 [Candidatus Gracilibacteria bacterium]|nr:MAG: hypothetical protein CSA08_04960 [Candidatus Gracilibacteria bacterium]